jgi:simple sugar transport system permease protein
MLDPAVILLLDAAVRTASPLALAALGETVTERAGVINVGLEGVIIAGALASAVGAAAGGVAVGIVAAVVAGVAVASVFAFFTVGLRTDQIITGTAVTIGALGMTSALYHVAFGASGPALTLPTLPVMAIPGLSSIPWIGRAFFAQPVTTYLAYAFGVGAAWFVFRTRHGLALRAVGEAPEAATAGGISVRLTQWFAVLVGGVLGGLAGAALVLAQVGTFAEGMSAGRGFIAIAVVALGRWHPLGVLAGAFLFGAATALQHLFQATGSRLPYQLFLALPYLLALGALAAGAGRAAAPAALGRRVAEDRGAV